MRASIHRRSLPVVLVFIALALAPPPVLAQSVPSDSPPEPSRVPGPGLAPVDFESSRGHRWLGFARPASNQPLDVWIARRPDRYAMPSGCRTPCRVYVPPARGALRLWPLGFAGNSTMFDVPPEGVAIRFLAPSPAVRAASFVFLGIGAGAVGVAGLAILVNQMIPHMEYNPVLGIPSVTSDTPFPTTIVVGALLVAAPAIVTGLALLLSARRGVESVRPLGMPQGAPR